jgi:hypothetical protein
MCQVCLHNQVKNIDRLLLAGAAPAAVGKKFGCSPAAMQRHQEHLAQKMAQAEQRFQASLHQGLFFKLYSVLEMVLGTIRAAQAAGDFKLCLQASREVSRLIKLMLKLDPHLEPEMLYCLVASPQWDLQDTLLPDPWTSLMQTRETLKLNLFAPCPEPDPEAAASLEASSPELAASASTALVPAAASPASTFEGQPLLPEIPARRQRAKSAKMPPKIGCSGNIKKEYQIDKRGKKIVPEKPLSLWEKFRRRWEKAGN